MKKSKIKKISSIFLLGFSLGFISHFVPIEGVSALFLEESLPRYSLKATNETFLPIAQTIIEREGYTLAYDGKWKIASWVLEKINLESLEGEANRKEISFCEDLSIPEVIRTKVSDYKNSGFDCGHLAPASDFQNSSKLMSETFFLSNVSPQNAAFNRGYWKHLEYHVRSLAKKYGPLEVITGPLFLPTTQNGKKVVSFEVIGESDIAVPTHFFKVITVRGRLQKQWAYILPNKEISSETPLDSFRVPIETIEKASGIIIR